MISRCNSACRPSSPLRLQTNLPKKTKQKKKEISQSHLHRAMHSNELCAVDSLKTTKHYSSVRTKECILSIYYVDSRCCIHWDWTMSKGFGIKCIHISHHFSTALHFILAPYLIALSLLPLFSSSMLCFTSLFFNGSLLHNSAMVLIKSKLISSKSLTSSGAHVSRIVLFAWLFFLYTTSYGQCHSLWSSF